MVSLRPRPSFLVSGVLAVFAALGCRDVTTEPVRGRPPPDVDPDVLCDQFCAATGSCYDDCAGACRSYQDSPCMDEGLAFTDCLVDFYDPTVCSAAGACGGEQMAYFDCRRAAPVVCEAEVCTGDDSACTCSRDCDGGRQAATCIVQGSVGACTCYLDALVVGDGIRSAAPAMELCSFSTGQCASLFGGAP